MQFLGEGLTNDIWRWAGLSDTMQIQKPNKQQKIQCDWSIQKKYDVY